MTTALQIAEKAVELADQNPDFVYVPPGAPDDDYRDCVYVDGSGKGSCLFGQAILSVGAADADYLIKHEADRIGTLLQRMVDDGLIEPTDVIDPAPYFAVTPLVRQMGRAQWGQDSNQSWADAVAELREYLGSVKA